MSGGFKLLMLLSTPFPLRPSAAICLARHSRLPLELLSSVSASRSRFLSVVPSSKLGFSIRAAEHAHSQEVAKEGYIETVTSNTRFSGSYSWPEWSKLTDSLLSKGYLQRPVVLSDEDDFFSTDGGFSDEFSRAAEACIKFARERPDMLRLLSKRCIETVVENGSPYLFRNGEKSVSRMRLFLFGNENNALETEKAKTIDIMRYLLSYMHHSFSTSNANQFKVGESVETSVRKLLLELFNLSGTIWRSKLPEPTTIEPLFGNEHLSRPREKSIEMKRGDWICQKCTFMNFARNMSCLECGEARPKSQLTGSEWECPQCDFFNYGRNISCLRCDCNRPGNLEHSRTSGSGESSSERLGSDTPDLISRSLDRILGRSTSSGNLSTTRDHNSSPSGNFSSSQIGQNTGKLRRNPDVAPFVPLPPDMFRKTPELNNDVQKPSVKGNASSSDTRDFIDSLLKSSENSSNGNKNKESSDASSRYSNSVPDDVQKSSVKGNASFSDTRDFIDSLFKSSENSSNKNKESSDASSKSSNSVSDDDFPDIMPIRKGENRFVVSKKKDRSLTSPAYKRRLAMEQTNSYNSIPFVPFPPDYFAKKDIQPAADSTENTTPSKAETLPENQGEQKSGFFDQGSARTSASQSSSYQNPTRNSSESTNSSWNFYRDVAVVNDASHSQTSNTSPTNYRSSSTQPSYGGFTGNSSRPSGRSRGDDSGGRSRGTSVANNASVSSPENTGKSDDYSFKSLEGSCVKEPDPLDMSEEAKAERWFRRAAQINDISELSQIPDEDFPEIMPMRKGVNRFVVSKRKTPLERRLTSPQYRKNLPVVSSEPEKDSIN